MGPFAEFAVVFGLCLVVLFVVIPAGTVESDNFGLSPRLLPIVAVSIIAGMAFITLIVGLVLNNPRGEMSSDGLPGVAVLAVATFVGVLLIARTGIVLGGTSLVVMTSFAIGIRRPVVLASMGGVAVLLLRFVTWSGL